MNALTLQVKDKPAVTCAEMGLTIESVFVPFSQSRNAGEKSPSLNWRVTLKRNGKNILTTDYMAGCGHCPSYKQGDNSMDRHNTIKIECETGNVARLGGALGNYPTAKKIELSAEDVIYSLIMDADAVEYDFEEWASNLGYSEDSREAERIYKACSEIGVKLMRSLGTDGLAKLRDAFQDY